MTKENPEIIKNGDGRQVIAFLDEETSQPIDEDIYIEFSDLTRNEVLRQLSNKTTPTLSSLIQFESVDDNPENPDEIYGVKVRYGSKSGDILYLKDFDYEKNTNLYIKTKSDKDFINISDLFKSVLFNLSKEDMGEGTYEGTLFKDIINAGSDDDLIFGFAGNDTIKGGNGDDTIYGGAGNDVITGGKGHNTINFTVGDGNDTINLTKGEQLELVITNENGQELDLEDFKYDYVNNGRDLRIIITEDIRSEEDFEIIDSIIIKNFGSADGTNNATKKTPSTGFVKINGKELKDSLLDIDILDDKFNGSWLNERIDASGMELEKRVRDGKTWTYVPKETTDAGMRINGNNGNDEIIGSKYSDTLNGGNGDDIIEGGEGNDSIIAGAGNDILTGGRGNDTLVGGLGENTFNFESGDGNDVIRIDARSTKNTIVINSGAAINFRADKKNLVIEYAGDTITIENGLNLAQSVLDKIYIKLDEEEKSLGEYLKDIPVYVSGEGVVNGTKLNDHIDLIEPSNPKTISVANAGAGDDKVYGTEYNDRINGGDGNDTIWGDNGNDTINGGNGDDVIDAGKGNDVIYGGNGDDIIDAGDGDDIVYGGNGNDTIIGGTGNNKLYGDGGENIFEYDMSYEQGEFIHDTIYSGKGTDTIDFSSNTGYDLELFKRNGSLKISGNDLIFKFENSDLSITIKDYVKLKNKHSVKYIKTDSETLTLEEFIKEVGITYDENDIKKGVLNGSVLSENFDLKQSSNGVKVNAGAGDDTILGSYNDDTIYGGDGDDYINGNGGNDHLYGGKGNNVFELDSRGNYTIFEERVGANNTLKLVSASGEFVKSGNDLIIDGYIRLKDYFVNAKNKAKYTLQIDEDNFSLEDFINGEYSEGVKVTGSGKINGSDLNDYITGSDKADVINAFGGNDTIVGGAGNDTLIGGLGENTFDFNAGDGNDLVRINVKSTKNTINFQGNFDISVSTNKNNLIIKYGDNSVTIENGLNLAQSVKDNIFIFANGLEKSLTEFLNDNFVEISSDKGGVINGTKINDEITGSNKNDKIYGGDGNDIIDGRGGNDTIYGGNGDDSILAGTGDNRLYGGSGNNTFYFVDDNLGENIIYEERVGARNTLVFEAVDENFVAKNGNDLILTTKGTGSVIIKDYFTKNIKNKATYYIQFGNSTEQLLEDYLASLDAEIQVSGSGTIYGTEYDDIINGSNKADIIYGLGGNDTIYAGKGNDKIYGGDGDDVIFCEEGNNRVEGGNGNDAINGSLTGRDTIYGGAGDDNILVYNKGNVDGGDDNDKITVLGTNNTIQGGNGDDEILVYNKSNLVHGGNDNDTIYVNGALNTVYGDDGDDIIYSRGETNTIYGGNGDDEIHIGWDENYNGNAERNIFAKHGTYNGGKGNDRYIIEDYDGTIDGVQASPLGKAFITDSEGDDTIVYSRYDHTEIKFMINFTKDGKIENFSKYGYDMIALNDYELNQTESTIECWNNDGGSYISASKLLEIENYETKDGYYVDNKTLQNVAQEVASWLADNGFTSVADMLKNSGNDLASNVTAVSNIINKTDLWQQYP